MADYRLSGYTTEATVSFDGTTNSGHVISSNVLWNTAWNGTGTFSSPSSVIKVGSTNGDPTLLVPAIYRAFLQFEIPANLSRLDDNPQLKIRCNSATGDGKVSIASIDYTNFASPWNTWTGTNAWKSAFRTNSAAYYVDGSDYYYTLTAGADYHTLTLSAGELAKFHCVTKRYVTVAILDYTFDRAGNPFTSPSGGSTYLIDSPSDSKPPLLVLRNPWFINDKGAEFPVEGNYVIAANDVGVNQFDRSVPQLPFSQNIRGPRSLRGKNVPYKVTT